MAVGKKLLLWLPALVWMGVIWGFSAQPTLQASAIDWQDFLVKKAAHIVEYFILTSFYLLPFKKSGPFSSRPAVIVAALAAAVFAVLDETHQRFVPGREGRVRDVAIDSIGIFLAAQASRNW